MKHLQKAPRKPLLNAKQGEIFILYLDNVLDKQIAQYIFVDGMTNKEVAEIVGYSIRQIERIRVGLIKTVLKQLIEKQTPKKPIWNKDDDSRCCCPTCNKEFYIENHHCECGQALNWGDTK